MMTRKREEQKGDARSLHAERTILVVEDDHDVRDGISATLRGEGYNVLAVSSESFAKEIALNHPLSLILLDATTTSRSIVEVYHQLHSSSDDMKHIPLLVLVAHERERIQMERQEIRADDYILKPLQKEELQACVQALLRRRIRSGKQRPTRVFRRSEREGMHEEYLLEIEDMSIDRARRTVRLGSHLLDIRSPVLFDLLVYFVLHRSTVLPREQLLRFVWGYDPSNTSDVRTVDVHVHWLRELLHDNAENPYWIQTVRGVGYRLRDEE